MNETIINGTLKAATTFIREKMASNDIWLIKGMLAIYARQTDDEQRIESTRYHNSIGFNGVDAEILSSFSKQVLEWERTPPKNRKYRSPLSKRQLEIVRNKMDKYAGQLVRVAREKAVMETTMEEVVLVDAD